MSELRSTATCLIKLNVLPSVGPQNDILRQKRKFLTPNILYINSKLFPSENGR